MTLIKSLLEDSMFVFLFGSNQNIRFTEYFLELKYNLKLGLLHNKFKIINNQNSDLNSNIQGKITVESSKKEYIRPSIVYRASTIFEDNEADGTSSKPYVVKVS